MLSTLMCNYKNLKLSHFVFLMQRGDNDENILYLEKL